MFEFEKFDRSLHGGATLEPSSPFEPERGITHTSLLVWGEHCTECAAPACYQTCDLYEKRPDERCRRFRYGAFRNRRFASARGFGAQIAFKKWGKLEARGNTRMFPSRGVFVAERALGTALAVLDRLGRLVRVLTRDIRWSYVGFVLHERMSRWLHRRAQGSTVKPDAFLLEVYNPTPEPLRFQVVLSIARTEIKIPVSASPLPSFRARVTLPPGYSRHEFPHRDLAAVTEAGLPFDVTLIPDGDQTPELVFLTADFVRLTHGRGSRAGIKTQREDTKPDIKCVVWDLDQTLWDGILLETDDVRPKENVVALIRKLDKVGILHSIASKNSFDHAWQKLEALGLDEYFLYPEIHWMPKADSLKRIAENLNIGIDTFAFVDDNPFELEQVRAAEPTVTCISIRDVDRIATDPRFKGSHTAEARSRRKLYREAMVRESTQRSFGDDYFAFLRSCDIRLRVRPPAESDHDRIDDLVQRTNQLNFSGRKYKRHEVQPLLADASRVTFVLDCEDKFGSYGTVGLAVARAEPGRIEVDDLMLSCRVQGKFIEQALFAELVRRFQALEPRRLWVNYTPTARNTPAREVLDAVGFVDLGEGKGRELDLTTVRLGCDFIHTSDS